MLDKEEEHFSAELEEIKSRLLAANTLEHEEVFNLMAYYCSLFQCAQAIAFNKGQLVTMKQGFHKVSDLISVHLDRLEKKIPPQEFREIQDRSEKLVEYVYSLFIRVSTLTY